jgi:DNA-binding SARP family transcriptional activator/tRNA A-37 threonylcarbamoyl transferase component Bud32
MALTLRLLGGARIETDAGPVQGRATQRIRLVLLALLAAAPRQSASREKLIRTLWPDSTPDAARRLLTEALYVFRKELSEDVVATSGDEVRLNPAVVRCDLVEFREAVAARDWRRAADLYGGPFLDGLSDDDLPAFARWAEEERGQVDVAYGRALRALAESAGREGAAADAVEWWGRLAAHDPYNSRAAVELMQALARAGERARALRFADTFTRRVRGELEIEPDGEVLRVVEQLRAAPAAAPDPVASGRGPIHVAEREGEPPPGEGFLEPGLQLVRRLGEGSVAEVFLAVEQTLGRLVAVKVLAERFADDDTTRTRFEREARAAARVHHPNVAPVYRVGRTAGGLPFIVTPYVDGGTLADRLAAAGRLSLEEVRRYVAQLAAALAAAHRLGVVHRDVRPANLLYSRELDAVMLADFGLAAVMELIFDQRARLTRPGEPLGSPGYASPEQLRGEIVTERADVYSLGVVAFELATGRLPYDAATPVRMIAAHLRDEPYRVSAFRPEADAALDDLVRRCLHKRPEERPFAADVAEVLGAARGGAAG